MGLVAQHVLESLLQGGANPKDIAAMKSLLGDDGNRDDFDGCFNNCTVAPGFCCSITDAKVSALDWVGDF